MRALRSSGDVWGVQCRHKVSDRALSRMPAENPAGSASLQGIAMGLTDVGCLLCYSQKACIVIQL